ncbi:MAG: tRNA (adenine-N1)-methyltransferase [Deltaproteobacteria bacterium]|nr:tRNA (adenine-N1)-methyltransferase [Deltaproteobacteria bacterium]
MTISQTDSLQPVQDQAQSLADQAEDRFGPDDLILFVGRQQKEYLAQLTPGRKIKLKGEYFEAEKFIGLPVGVSVVTPLRAAYLTMRPTLQQRIMNMPRQAQIIYPKDLGLILFWADIQPGSKVLEVGVGHGALTLALVRAVGQEGRVISYEIRTDHARRTRNNVKRYLGQTPWWQIKTANPVETGFDETNLDAALIDMPSPWELVAALVPAIRPGGTAVFFLPTVPQVVKLVEELKASGKFAHLQTMELLLRPWKIEAPSVRPVMHISGHTGFIISCRRKLGQVVRF